jgi:hypothetical protein
VLDWRWCLYVQSCFAAAGRGRRVPAAPPSRGRRGRDSTSAGTIAASLRPVRDRVRPLPAETDGWASPVTIGFLAAGAILLPRSSACSAACRHPLLPLALVADRNSRRLVRAIAVGGAGIFALFLFLTFYFQNTKGMTPLETGLAFLPLSVSIIAARRPSARACSLAPGRGRSCPGMVSAALGMALLTRIRRTRRTPRTSCPPCPHRARLRHDRRASFATRRSASQARDSGVVSATVTPRSRSAARSARRCSARWPPPP